MGDFERTFGAGADIDAIIDGYSRDFIREQRKQWRSQKSESGYKSNYDRAIGREVYFSTYDEMIAWDIGNPGAVYVRRRRGSGFEMKVLG